MANMNKKKLNLSKPIRIPQDMATELDRALNLRLQNNLIPRSKANYPEALNLIGRMPEWKIALDKLAKLPRKEDIRW